MSFFDRFTQKNQNGPEIIEEHEEKSKKETPREEIIDFSFNESRFGHFAEGGYFKSEPKTAGLFGFFEFVQTEISQEEYLMWKDCTDYPEKYLITAKKGPRGFMSYSIKAK